MKVLWFILKILIMLGLVAVVAIPLIGEYLSFRKDRKDKITYKRFRILVYSVIYFIAITVVFVVLKDLILWVESWKVIQWLSAKIAIPARLDYAWTVFSVMAINLGIGLLYRLVLRLVRIGLKKRDLVNPKKKDGSFSWSQKMERAVLKFFYKEKWFFAARILLFLCLTLSAVYSLLFILNQIPIFFGASWLPYKFMTILFDSLYYYPVLSLLPMYNAYYFLEGVRLLEDECPELFKEQKIVVETSVDLEKVHEECKKQFKDFYRSEMRGPATASELSSTQYHALTQYVAESVENSQRNAHPRKEGYLRGLDVIIRNDIADVEGDTGAETTGVIVNGGFFTGFSTYFLRYVTAILSRGDNVVFVCNDCDQVATTKDYVEKAFAELYSLYYQNAATSDVKITFDHPLWKVCAISGDDKDTIDRHRLDDRSVLVTDLKYLASSEFKLHQSDFANLIDTVVFVDVLEAVNRFPQQMVMFDTAVRNLRDLNELRAKNSSKNRDDRRVVSAESHREFLVRYTSKQIKYVCFNDSRTPGLDKVLKNLLAVDFVSTDAMEYTSNAIICCYDYEGRPNEQGIRVCPQAAQTREELGALVNMADFALAYGGGTVSLFAQNNIPYGDIVESVSANANHGLTARDKVNLFINAPFYNPDDYRVIVAFDTTDNLPETVRRYAAVAGDKPTLVMLFSRPYMFRDYYADNIDDLWKREQIMRVPVEQSVKRSAIQKILVCAATGGITKTELYGILKDYRISDYQAMVDANDLVGILRAILAYCGKPKHGALQEYFEFDSVRDFDRNGIFRPEERISLRKTGSLYDLIDGRALTRLLSEGGETVLTLPRNRITQNYIVGQNLLHNGMVYTIQNIDTNGGRIYVSHATGGRNNVSYQYRQDRQYHIVWDDSVAETVFSKKHIEPHTGEEFGVNEVFISVKRRPMEVATNGYTPIDHHTLARNGSGKTPYVDITGKEFRDLFRQTYRKYGNVTEPVYSTDEILGGQEKKVASTKGALVMSVKLSGSFGDAADRIATLAAAMLGETLQAMFPSAADSIAVCPVVSHPFEDEESRQVLNKQYKVECRGYEPSAQDIELLIIEDCPDDLGVISALYTSGDDLVYTLFEPIYKYLAWYSAAEKKSDYLYYGLDHEPACFDFESLHKLSKILGDRDHTIEFVETEAIVDYDGCDFCGKRYPKGDDILNLEDGRQMCQACAASVVGNNKKELKAALDRARRFLESTYGIFVSDKYEFCFESTAKVAQGIKNGGGISRRGTDLPLLSYIDEKKRVHIEYALPSANLAEVLVRELTHVWQLENMPHMDEELAEGQLALVGIQYQRFLNLHSLAASRTTYFESNDNLSGIGYRRLVAALLANPQYRNNSFAYLLAQSGTSDDQRQEIIPPTPPVLEEGDYGLPYTPAQPDRVLDGPPPYYYRSCLTATCQQAFDTIVAGIRAHQAEISVVGCTQENVSQILRAVMYDCPDLFWFCSAEYTDTSVCPVYGATAEECEVLQRRIDQAVAKYLEGIDDSMSAYDVALRLHLKMIGAVDYDTIALNKEEQAGGPAEGKIDYLRTICGVFLEGKAVCGGYARAMQYLLQKCGIESAEALGYIHKADGSLGELHGWNLVKLDGDYYYLDTTWDDSSNTIQAVKNTDTALDYFCFTTEELSRTRDTTKSPAIMPNCTATRCNFYYHNGLVLDAYNPDKVQEWAVAAAQRGKPAFAFKCGNKKVYEAAFAALCADGADCFKILKAAAKGNKKVDPNGYRYRHDPNMLTITIIFKNK